MKKILPLLLLFSVFVARADEYTFPPPASLPPSGAAGGQLAGTYPNPTLSFALDGSFTLRNTADPTKKVAFVASGISTATTRSLTIPNYDFTLAATDHTQTFSATQTFAAAPSMVLTDVAQTGAGTLSSISGQNLQYFAAAHVFADFAGTGNALIKPASGKQLQFGVAPTTALSTTDCIMSPTAPGQSCLVLQDSTANNTATIAQFLAKATNGTIGFAISNSSNATAYPYSGAWSNILRIGGSGIAPVFSLQQNGNDFLMGSACYIGAQVTSTNGTSTPTGSWYLNAAGVWTPGTTGRTGGGTFAFNSNTQTQITSNQNDFTPASKSYVQRWSSDASRNVTGMATSTAQVDSQIHVIINVGAQNIVLVNQSASSAAANRFLNSTGADITLSANQAAEIFYDSTQSRWLVFKKN